MEEDDFIPKHKQPQLFPRTLEGLSVAAMREYIEELEVEIAKVQAEIQQRGGIRNAAENLFGKKSD